MKIYTLPDGSTVAATDQFQIGDQRYPVGWLETALDADIADAGITVKVIPDPVVPRPPIVISSLGFRQLFTEAERTAVTSAGFTNAAIRVFMDDESAAGNVTLSDSEVTTGVAALVTAGLLTQDRANQVLAGAPPAHNSLTDVP
jgi:hypothetical protein